MRGKMDCFGLTDVGRKREVNEDQFLIADLSKSMLIHQSSLSQDDHTRLFGGSQGTLFLVADGMGGHAEGKRASSLAVQTLTHYVLNIMHWLFYLDESHESDLLDELKESLEQCQRSIREAASPTSSTMGTTVTMAYLLWPRLYVVHVGDSRCYLLRGEQLEQVTTDHTVTQRMVDSGAMSPEQAQKSRWSHVLWNCVGGGSPHMTTDVYKANLKIGDTILLCTDGLTTGLSDERIKKMLHPNQRAEQTCHALVGAANEADGRDNVTVLVARFHDAREELVREAEQAAVFEDDADTVPSMPVPAKVAAAGVLSNRLSVRLSPSL
jgi:protein phosphatase